MVLGAIWKSLFYMTRQNQSGPLEFDQPTTPPPAGGRGGRGPMVPDSFSILVVGK